MSLARLTSVARTLGSVAIALMALYGVAVVLGSNTPVLSATLRFLPGWEEATTQDVAVPTLLDYQGTLRDVEGEPLSGYYTMTFRIYDSVAAPISATLWSEQHISITVRWRCAAPATTTM